MSISTLIRMGLSAVVLSVGAMLASTATASDARGFSFSSAEMMPGDSGLHAARAFVAEQLPNGLPVDQAIARAERTGVSCHRAPAPGAVIVCEYLIISHPDGGDLGEDVWTLHLLPASDGTLKTAIVARSRVGMPGLFN